MNEDDIIFIEIEKYEGKEIIFTRKKLEQKKDDHPELLKKKFLKCAQKALKEPDKLWENYQDKRKRCYYKKYSVSTIKTINMRMNNVDIKEKKNIVDAMANLSEMAKQEGWITSYDPEADSLSVRKPHLSKESYKKYTDDEFAFYLNRKKEVEGVFMEYFLSNFVSHHKKFRPVVKELRNKKEEEEPIKLKKSETKKLVDGLGLIMLDVLSLGDCAT